MGQDCSCGAGRPRRDRPASPVEPRPPPLEGQFPNVGFHSATLPRIDERDANGHLRANAEGQALFDTQAGSGGKQPQRAGDALAIGHGKPPKHPKKGEKVHFGGSESDTVRQLGERLQLDDRQLIDRRALERQGIDRAKLDRAALDQKAPSRLPQPRDESLHLDPAFLEQLAGNDQPIGPRPPVARDHPPPNDYPSRIPPPDVDNINHDVGTVHPTKPDEIVHLDNKVAGSHDLHSDTAVPPVRITPSRLHDLHEDVRVPANLGASASHNIHADAKVQPPRIDSPAHDLHKDVRTPSVRTTSSPAHGIHTDPVVGSVIGTSKPHLLRLDHKDDPKRSDLMRAASGDGASDPNQPSPGCDRPEASQARSRRSEGRSSESNDGTCEDDWLHRKLPSSYEYRIRQLESDLARERAEAEARRRQEFRDKVTPMIAAGSEGPMATQSIQETEAMLPDLAWYEAEKRAATNSAARQDRKLAAKMEKKARRSHAGSSEMSNDGADESADERVRPFFASNDSPADFNRRIRKLHWRIQELERQKAADEEREKAEAEDRRQQELRDEEERSKNSYGCPYARGCGRMHHERNLCLSEAKPIPIKLTNSNSSNTSRGPQTVHTENTATQENVGASAKEWKKAEKKTEKAKKKDAKIAAKMNGTQASNEESFGSVASPRRASRSDFDGSGDKVEEVSVARPRRFSLSTVGWGAAAWQRGSQPAVDLKPSSASLVTGSPNFIFSKVPGGSTVGFT